VKYNSYIYIKKDVLIKKKAVLIYQLIHSLITRKICLTSSNIESCYNCYLSYQLRHYINICPLRVPLYGNKRYSVLFYSIHIQDRSLSWLSTGISIKTGRVLKTTLREIKKKKYNNVSSSSYVSKTK
jgi:hypothetical protein